MDNFEFNKVAGAILGTALFVLVLTIITDALYSEPELEQQAYVVDLGDLNNTTMVASEGEVEKIDVTSLLVLANAEDGSKVAKKCVSCHNFESGGANKIGPNLYNIVDRQMASIDSFGYSKALSERGNNSESWGFENLFYFLENPKKWLPGTIMGYAGIRKPSDRADLIAYLHEISPDSASVINK